MGGQTLPPVQPPGKAETLLPCDLNERTHVGIRLVTVLEISPRSIVLESEALHVFCQFVQTPYRLTGMLSPSALPVTVMQSRCSVPVF